MKADCRLKLDKVTWGYNTNSLMALPVSLEISAPAFVLLLGANGTGKSTLLKTLGGLINPVSGDVVFNNLAVREAGRKGSFVSFVFAQRPQVDFMKVKDLVLSGFDTCKNPFAKLTSEQFLRYEFALEATGSGQLQDSYINKVSDGEFQKAMIARALVQNSPMILLDEPTAFLDYKSKRELFELLSDIAHKEQKIIIASTHDPDLAQEKGEIFWLIQNGEFRVVRKSELGERKLREELV